MNRITPQDIADFDAINSALDKAHLKLTKFGEGLEAAIGGLRQEAASLTNELKGLNTATESGRATNSRASQKVDELERAYRQLQSAYSENKLELERVRLETNKMNAVKRAEIQLMASAETSYNNLSAKYRLLKVNINALTREQRENTAAGRAMVAQAKEIYEEMDRLQKATGKAQLSVGGYAKAIGSLKANFLDFVKGGFIIAGVQAITNAVSGLGRKVVDQNRIIGDSLADVQRLAKLTSEEAQGILSELKGLDTRTALDDLLKLSAIGARLGVSKTELAAFTASLDKLKVALGSELGQDAEETATKLGKLATIFGDDKNITGDELLQIGNAVVDLSNKGTATGQFLSDFSQRLAGLSGIAKVTLGQALGLGAGFEELGQSSEVAGTAVTQLVLKIGQDVPKYAKLAGKSAAEFGKTINENPVEALIQLAQGLSTNKDGFAELSEGFKEAEARGVRVTATLGVLGKNADFFRQKINEGSAALQRNDQILAAFAIKNQTFGALLDKLGKSFLNLFTNRGLSGFGDFFKGGVLAATNFLDAINDLLDPTAKLTRELKGTQETVSRLEKELPSLLTRYDELKAKTTPTKEEQRELGDVIKRIGELTPTAITEVDKYGNALSINAAKSREFLEAEKARLTFINKDLIKSLETEVAKAQQLIEYRQKLIRQGNEPVFSGGGGGGTVTNVGLRPERIRELQAEIANYQNIITGATAQLNFLKTGQALVNEETEKAAVVVNEYSDALGKNNSEKEKAIEKAEKLAQKLAEQANAELRAQRELAELLKGDQSEDFPLLDELFGATGKEGLPNQAYSIGANVAAAFGEGFGDAPLLPNSIDANRLKDFKEKAEQLKTNISQSLGLTDGIQEKSGGILSRLFGLEFTDDDKDRIKDALSFAKSQLEDYMQAVQRAADQRVQAADRAVNAAENEYNRQFELAAQGKANTALQAAERLRREQREQQDALQNQRRLQRQQIILNSALEASNLALAVSKLFAEKSILAIPLSALMVGSFIAAKVAAFRASRQEFAEGGHGEIGGGTHASGNDTNLGFKTKEGKQAYAERGELFGIVRHERAQRYKPIWGRIVDSMNAGTFEQTFGAMSADGAKLAIYHNTSTTDTRRMEGYLSQIAKQGNVKRQAVGNVIITEERNLTVTRRVA